MEWIGCVGAAAFALAWIPQTIETVKARRCQVNLGFLSLAALGSLSLMIYAALRGDLIFFLVNALTTGGALVNVFYKFHRSDPN